MKLNESGFEKAVEILPQKLKSAVMRCQQRPLVDEIRLCSNKPLCVSILSKPYMLCHNGQITQNICEAVIVTEEDVDFSFKSACRYSVYSFEEQISQGFITIEGGNRVGISATAVTYDNKIHTLKDINCLNIRIARQVKGCAQNLYEKIQSRSILIAGKPSSGKTTLLRDLARILGNSHRISIIDRRNEICAVSAGIAQFDTGVFCDIFTMYPQGAAIEAAIRAMSPEFLICDEIGTKEDLSSLLYAVNSGVKLICTTHSGSISEAVKRKYITPLIAQNSFDCAVCIRRNNREFEIVDYIDFNGDKKWSDLQV